MTCKTVSSIGAALLLHDLAGAEGRLRDDLRSAPGRQQWAFFLEDGSVEFGPKMGSSDFMLCFHLLWFCVFAGNCYICHLKLVPNPGTLVNEAQITISVEI